MNNKVKNDLFEYNYPALNSLRKFLKDTYSDPNDLLSSKKNYMWVEASDTKTSVIMIYDKYLILINCIYGFYGFFCDQNEVAIYADDCIVNAYKNLWKNGIKNYFLRDVPQAHLLKKHENLLFNKKSQIEKYADDYFKDTLSMLSVINDAEKNDIPCDLSLKNLHDYLSETIELENYRHYETDYIKYNKDISKLSGRYLDKYDVIIPKDIYEHHKYGVRFKNCIVSYIQNVNKVNKILFVFSDNKPLYCAEITSNFVLKQATKVCNESLSSQEMNDLKNILNKIKTNVQSK